MLFSKLCDYLEILEQTTSRNEMTISLAELLCTLESNEIQQAIYMLQGRVAPKFLPIEFNFATKLLLKALALFSNQEEKKVKNLYSTYGDVGLVAAELGDKSEKNGLHVLDVFQKLEQITESSGKNSQTEKARLYIELIKKMTDLERKFLSRIIVGKLRLGLSDKTILDALFVGDFRE